MRGSGQIADASGNSSTIAESVTTYAWSGVDIMCGKMLNI
jgi:hypothetical protein